MYIERHCCRSGVPGGEKKRGKERSLFVWHSRRYGCADDDDDVHRTCTALLLPSL